MRRGPSRWRGEGGLRSSRARPVTGKIFHRRRGLRYYYCGSGRTGAIAGVYSLLGTSANGIREWGRPGSSPENLGLVMGPTGRHNYESASKDRRGYITLKQALCDRAFRSDARGSCGGGGGGGSVVSNRPPRRAANPKKCSSALQHRSTYCTFLPKG